jgi:hypothetical protein
MQNEANKMSPQQIKLLEQKQFRIIPSVFPPINFFEDLVDASEMEALWEIESLTNERLRQEAGDIFLVPTPDRVCGAGSSIVMAAFTHIGRASRFTDGSYGVYYAGFSQETAIRETIYHRERFLSATNEEACEVTMRLYEGIITKPLHDIRLSTFDSLHHPEDYAPSQLFGKDLRATKAWGIVYNSVRHEGGHCVAIFRPPAISNPKPISHFRYVWNGEKVIDILDVKSVLHVT